MRYARQMLPKLIDVSEAYGDNCWTTEDYEVYDAEIAKIELQIATIDDPSMYLPKNNPMEFFELCSESSSLENTIHP